jgi:Flp pilus assembly protein TadG
MTRNREHGSATAEFVLLTPLLILFVFLIIGFGRLTHARALVTDAAAQAARAATLAYPTPTAATTAAQQTASAALEGSGLSCASQTTNTDTAHDHPGGTITVTVTCRVNLADVMTAGFPGTLTLTRAFTSPIDVYVPGSLGFANSEVPVGGNPRGGVR